MNAPHLDLPQNSITAAPLPPLKGKVFLRELYKLVGKRVAILLMLSAPAGLALSCVEQALAAAIKGFLGFLGVTSVSESSKLLSFLPQTGAATVVVYLIAFGAMRAALGWLNYFLAGAVQAHFSFRQRTKLIEWAFQSKNVIPSEVTTLFNEVVQNSSDAIKSLGSCVMAATASFFLAVILVYLSPKLSLIAFFFLLVLGVLVRRLSRICKRAGQGIIKEWNMLHSRLMTGIRNLLFMRIYGIHKDQERLSIDGLAAYRGHFLMTVKVGSVQAVLPQLAGLSLMCMLAIVGKSSTDGLSPGTVLAYFYVLFRCIQQISNLMNAASNLFFFWPQVDTLLVAQQSRDYAPLQARVRPLSIRHKKIEAITSPIGWRLSHATYTYPNGRTQVIRELNLTIAPGSTTILTGPSGSGKSTVLNLLIGELKPALGTIEVELDGRMYPIEAVEDEILSSIGYVTADSFIIGGTILDNLYLGLKNHPTDKELDQVLKQAECHFIDHLPLGLAHKLWENGEGLSSGQRQRLSLARALLRKPKALILDEVTSNLDHTTEEKLLNTLAKLKGQFTIIATTHRPVLLRIADQHIKMD